jgi:SAM-dependent methyltransferase
MSGWSIRTWARAQYAELVVASGKRYPVALPEGVLRAYNYLAAFEQTQAVLRLVGEKQRVLLVGDAGGRDYFTLRMAGKKVWCMDLAPQRNIPNLVLADVTRPLPVAQGAFDAVVMAEVIEHLIEDHAALQNVWRVLTDTGVLVLTLPFGHDAAEFHVRIHSARTIRRLLEASGFVVESVVFKGGGFALLDHTVVYPLIKHSLNYLAYRLAGRTFYGRLNRFLSRLDWALGVRNSILHRLSPFYGGYIQCSKRPEGVRDFGRLNVEAFSHFFSQEQAADWKTARPRSG